MGDASVPADLWFLPDRSRFFLVPREVRLPPGPERVHGLPLRRRHVDLEILARWEVGADEARAHVDGAVVGAMGRARTAVEGMFGLEPEGDDVVPPEEELEAMARSAAGASVGDLVLDPGKAREVARNLLDRVGRTARELTPDAEERAALRARLEEVERELLDPEGPLAKGAATLQGQVEQAMPILEARAEKLWGGLKDVARRVRDER